MPTAPQRIASRQPAKPKPAPVRAPPVEPPVLVNSTQTDLGWFPGSSVAVHEGRVASKPSVGLVVKHAVHRLAVHMTGAEARAHAAALLAMADVVDPPASKSPTPVASRTPPPDRTVNP